MTDATQVASQNRLEHFHVTFFASVMGLAGLALALKAAQEPLGLPQWLPLAALVLAAADFAFVAVMYVLKALRHPAAVRGEWHHPVKLAFFPAISISLLLIATALRPVSMEAARLVWLLGAAGQGVLTLAVISGWIGHRTFQQMHISPAWFIPAVGNVVAPVAGVSLGYVELSWMFFSAGLLFWVVLLTLVMNRLIFHDPLPGRLLPTLVILIAPPAVAFLAWLQLNGGQIDAMARILFYVGVVFAAIVAIQAPGFAKLPFALSWWALSFPAAALTIATIRYAQIGALPGLIWLGAVLLVLLVAIVAMLILRTFNAAMRGDICKPE